MLEGPCATATSRRSSPRRSTTWRSRARSTPRPCFRAGSATTCCSSARTSSRCSRSSCAAPTTRWRTSTPAKLARGVICASAGNHAQGVALAAQRLGADATVVMPVTTPRIKVSAVAARGAKVVLHGDSYHEASLHAKALARKKKPHLRAPLRRPAGDRRAGHHRHGDPAPASAPHRRDLRSRGRRRAHRRHRVLREGGVAAHPHHRRGARGFERDAGIAQGGQARDAART